MNQWKAAVLAAAEGEKARRTSLPDRNDSSFSTAAALGAKCQIFGAAASPMASFLVVEDMSALLPQCPSLFYSFVRLQLICLLVVAPPLPAWTLLPALPISPFGKRWRGSSVASRYSKRAA